MQKILLDSDILIDFLHGIKKEPFAAFLSEKLFLSAVSYSEVLYGQKKVSKLGKVAKEVKIDKILEDLSIDILSFDQKVAAVFVDIKLSLETRGEAIPDFDLIIAASAIVEDLELLTNNRKHFSRIDGLKLVDRNNLT